MIGLCGAQRTGKSTLAKEFAEDSGVDYVPVNTSGVFEAMGFDPKADYDMATRMQIQWEILKAAQATYAKAPRFFITDRTPLDMLAYTLADVQRGNVTGEVIDQVVAYADKCFSMTNQYFTSIVVVQPGIPLVEEAGKAPANLAHMEHINTLILGLANDERCKTSKHYIARGTTDLQARVRAIYRVMSSVSKRHDEARKQVSNWH